MIVKILSASKSFDGIHYSERKNSQGKSELLEAQNFDALGHVQEELTKKDMINYMKAACNLNTNVKNKQFHAIISTKGKEHSPEELKHIAVKYLAEMGYHKNPYLIYYHSDTPNNHVHLVSTRVDPDGNKVDDSFEKIRSQKVLQKIMLQYPKEEAKQIFNKTLQYNFSTMAQFKLILEQEGYKVHKDKDLIKLIKYGTVQGSFDKVRIKNKMRDYNTPEKRIAQLRSIFRKYKKRFDPKDFVPFVKEKFGLAIIFHQKEGHEKPYGYTIIDHSKREIYKGSQIMPLNELLSELTREDKITKADHLIDRIQHDKLPYSSFRNQVSGFDLNTNKNGSIAFKYEKKPIFQLNKDQLKSLNYYERAKHASQYRITNNDHKKVLARLFFINPEELKSNLSYQESLNTYQNLVNNLDQNSNLNDGLHQNNFRVIRFDHDHFLLDTKGKALFSMKDILNRNVDFKMVEVIDLNSINNSISYPHHFTPTNDKGSLLSMIFELIGSIESANSVDNKRKKQRKIK